MSKTERRVLALMQSSHQHIEPVEVTVPARINTDTHAEADLELIEAKARDLIARDFPQGTGPWRDTADTFELVYAFVAITDGIVRGRILPLHQVEFEVDITRWK